MKIASFIPLFLLIGTSFLPFSIPSISYKPFLTNSDSVIYHLLIKEINRKHDSLSNSFEETDRTERSIFIEKTKPQLLTMLYKQIIPQWIGTKWEFYGETQVPGDSSIACGHFVVTTLNHLGILI